MTNKAFKKIYEFHENIENYRRSLNLEAIWLFVATLGCWSVSNDIIRVFSLSITFFLFSFQAYHRLPNKKSFEKIRMEAQREINALPNPEIKDQYQKELDEIVSTKLSTSSAIAGSSIFFLCFSFWFLSVIYWAMPKFWH